MSIQQIDKEPRAEEETQAAPAGVPRPEHPRPDRERRNWMNLNGEWEFAETNDTADESWLRKDKSYPGHISVPFCRESKLSGLSRKGFVKNVWYRRTFRRPSWPAPRVRLHIGACDWHTRVWVNNKLAGRHTGGNCAFSFDITDALGDSDKFTVVIHAYDATRSGLQALGKQSDKLRNHSIFYTRTTGIWQTVWLEGAGAGEIGEFSVVPDAGNSRVIIQADISHCPPGAALEAEAHAGGRLAGSASAPAAGRNMLIVLDLGEKHLWSPEHPFLYDLTLRLTRDGATLDKVRGYFGLRSVAIDGAVLLLNGKPLFQRLVLDQGFYPDGVWTAPTDEALRRDIELSKALGFNGARLHQKVFEPRFLYWADRLGYLVWGEYPSYGAHYHKPSVNNPITREWAEIVRRDRNHPSIIGWCPFNETPRQAGELQNTIVDITKALDPTRPVIDASGWSHSHPQSDLLDQHDYDQNPAAFRRRWHSRVDGVRYPARYQCTQQNGAPFFISEYGGIGWNIGNDGWGYGNAPGSLDEFYERHAGLTNTLLDNRFLCGFCYTQLTDVEQEKNGLYTFDRKPKFDAARLAAINARRAACEVDPPLAGSLPRIDWRVLIGGWPDGELAAGWRISAQQPPDSWAQPGFDDSGWRPGRWAFGAPPHVLKSAHAERMPEEFWIRAEFEYNGANFDILSLLLHFDGEAKACINGAPVWNDRCVMDEYVGHAITGAARPHLKKGANLIAIHCQQLERSMYFDAVLLTGNRLSGKAGRAGRS
ncbi:MAG: glycoside hydrolase family 2 TIM barrel-domain containing protein [bacterium]